MVLAGPGSGKTSVIVNRIAYLIQKGVPPEGILVVTFSRAAAAEMKIRFLKGQGIRNSPVTFGTFHGIFYGILKHAYSLGPENILSEKEKYQILQELAQNAAPSLAQEGDFLEEVSREISVVKGGRIKIANYYSSCCPDEVFRQICIGYGKILRERRKLDFDDMLLFCYELFVKRKDILEKWQQRFPYILVDEFQDISPLQYDTLRLLAEPRNNLFIVGDDDQSIYHFRGARPEIMLHFPKDYPEAARVLLDINYRCTGNVLEAGLRLIAHNQKRYPKKLSTPNPPGEKVESLVFENPPEQYRFLAELFQKDSKEGRNLSDSAVLFRTNQEAEGLIRVLMEYQVPFTIREQIPNIFHHFICQDLMAYLRLASGNLSRKDFIRIMNRPNRYISREAMQQAGPVVTREALLSFYEGKDWMEDRITTLFTHLHIISDLPPYAAVNFIRKGVGYEEFLQEYAAARNIRPEEMTEILDQIHESARGRKTLAEWEQAIEEYTRQLEKQAAVQETKTDGVVLSTLHRVKGLEYGRVYIVNVNEGTIPYRKAVLPDALEEERRLFYVGITRASEKLTLLHVRKQFEKIREPSRFLREILD